MVARRSVMVSPIIDRVRVMGVFAVRTQIVNQPAIWSSNVLTANATRSMVVSSWWMDAVKHAVRVAALFQHLVRLEQL